MQKISNTPFDQRSLIHREVWFPDGPRIPQNLNYLKNRKKIIQNAKTQKRLKICQNLRYALRPEAKSDKKLFFLFGNFRNLPN